MQYLILAYTEAKKLSKKPQNSLADQESHEYHKIMDMYNYCRIPNPSFFLVLELLYQSQHFSSEFCSLFHVTELCPIEVLVCMVVQCSECQALINQGTESNPGGCVLTGFFFP